MKSDTRPSIRAVTTPSTTLVAICKKCGKKVGGGFGDGGKKSLAKALVKHLDLPKWKRSPIRIVETGCMKLCPRRAVAVTTSREPGVVYVVPAGTPVAEVVARLSLTPCHPGERRDP
jgi:predicted metal-binding protein